MRKGVSLQCQPHRWLVRGVELAYFNVARSRGLARHVANAEVLRFRRLSREGGELLTHEPARRIVI